MSVKELQGLCGRLDFMHIHDERKLVFWSRISSMKSVVMRTCYGILSDVRPWPWPWGLWPWPWRLWPWPWPWGCGLGLEALALTTS